MFTDRQRRAHTRTSQYAYFDNIVYAMHFVNTTTPQLHILYSFCYKLHLIQSICRVLKTGYSAKICSKNKQKFFIWSDRHTHTQMRSRDTRVLRIECYYCLFGRVKIRLIKLWLSWYEMPGNRRRFWQKHAHCGLTNTLGTVSLQKI